jgi:hypothetical protein
MLRLSYNFQTCKQAAARSIHDLEVSITPVSDAGSPAAARAQAQVLMASNWAWMQQIRPLSPPLRNIVIVNSSKSAAHSDLVF